MNRIQLQEYAEIVAVIKCSNLVQNPNKTGVIYTNDQVWDQ